MSMLPFIYGYTVSCLIIIVFLLFDLTDSWLLARFYRSFVLVQSSSSASSLSFQSTVKVQRRRHGVLYSTGRINANDNTTTISDLVSEKNDTELLSSLTSSPVMLHHTAIQTTNLTRAIMFYSTLLGLKVLCEFRAGPARAAWLGTKNDKPSCQLELIEVPAYMTMTPNRRAVDVTQYPTYVGPHHFAFDVTAQIKDLQQQRSYNVTLRDWMNNLNATSLRQYNKTVRTALMPRQQIIGNAVYELAFIYDADGCLVELLHFQKQLTQQIDSGWKPWNGTHFIGQEQQQQQSSSNYSSNNSGDKNNDNNNSVTVQ